MLRYKEKEDLEARLAQVEDAIDRWRVRADDAAQAVTDEFRSKVIIGLLFHDSALEGEVLSYSEIKAAIDQNIISDASLIPGYETTNNFFAALEKALEHARTPVKGKGRSKKSKQKTLQLETIRTIYGDLMPSELEKELPYRKDNPLHRLYYHDIAAPETIPQEMKKYGEWLESDQLTSLHPIEQAAAAHWQFMAIFPWLKNSGRVARIISNYLLEAAGLPLAVIHSIDRQRYYEALKSDQKSLYSVYLEAVEATATAAIRVYDEAASQRRNRRHAS